MNFKKFFIISLALVLGLITVALNVNINAESITIQDARTNANANLITGLDSRLITNLDSITYGATGKSDLKCDDRSAAKFAVPGCDYVMVGTTRKAWNDLSFYQSVTVTDLDKKNEYGKFGLYLGDDADGISYYAVIEPNRGYAFIESSQNNAFKGEDVLFTENQDLKDKTTYKLEVVKQGDDYSFYVNDTLLGTTTKDLTVGSGVFVFGYYAQYQDATFKCLETYTEYNELDYARTLNQNLITGKGTQLVSNPDSVTYGAETNDLKCDGRTAYQFTSLNSIEYVNVNGVKTSVNKIDYYYSVTISNLDRKDQYGSFGLYVGTDAEGCKHFMVIEPLRGFAFDYKNNGTSESVDNLFIENQNLANQASYTIEIIRKGAVLDMYVNNTKLATLNKELTAEVGLMVNGYYANYSNLTFKCLSDGVTNYIEKTPIEKARESEKANLITALGEKIIDNFDSVTYGAETNDLKCDDRVAYKFVTGYEKYVSVDGKKTASTDLNLYYSVTITNLDKKNEYGKVGLYIGADENGNNHYLVFEPGRGFAFVDKGTNNVASEDALFTDNQNLANQTSYTLEVLRTAGKNEFYVNGVKLCEYNATLTAEAGIFVFGYYASYSNPIFKVLTDNVEKYVEKSELDIAKENVTGNLLFSLGEHIIECADAVEFGKESNALKSDGRTAWTIKLADKVMFKDGKVVTLSDVNYVFGIKVTDLDQKGQYGSVGLYLGKDADGTQHYFTFEIGRGFAFHYTRGAAENQDALFTENQNLANKEAYNLDVVKSGNTYTFYVNDTKLCSLELALTNEAGVMVCQYYAQYQDAYLAYEKGLDFVDAKVYEYRTSENPNLVTGLGEKVINGLDAVGYGAETNDLKCDDRSSYVFTNSMKSYVLLNNEKTASNKLDYYMAYSVSSLERKNDYGKVGIYIGQDADGKNYYLVFEPGRGFAFVDYGTSNVDGEDVLFTENQDLAGKAEYLLEVIKVGNVYSLYVNGTKLCDYEKELTFRYGIIVFGYYAQYANPVLKCISTGVTEYTYHTNCDLADIKVKGTTINGFDKDTVEYNFEVATEQEFPTSEDVEVSVADETAKAQITIVRGIVTIVVTAEDELTTKTYVVSYGLPKSSDASIAQITVNGTALTIADTMAYTAPAHTTKVAKGDIKVTTTDAKANAEVSVNGNVATVKVTAEDGTTKTYTINVTLNLSSDATLKSITVGGETVKDFNSNTKEYNVTTTEEVGVADIEFETTDSYAKANVKADNGKYIITVTAEDGTTNTYTLTVEVGAKSGCKKASVAAVIVAMMSAFALIAVLRKH